MTMKIVLTALALLVAACGSGDGDDAAEAADDASTTVADSAADDEPTDTSADDTSTTATDDDSTETTAGDAAGADEGIGPLLSTVFAGAGVEPSEETVQCIQERGADLDVNPLEATEKEVATATVTAFACAADELAPLIAADTTPPEGTDVADVECVIAETFRYFGDIPPDEAIAALDADTVPQEFRDAVLPVAEAACGLGADQVEAIFDAN